MAGFRSRKRETGPPDVHDSDSSATQIESQHTSGHSKSTIKQATKTRRNAIIFACICYALTIIFLIVVQIGNTPGSGVRQNIYFLKLDLSNIVAQSLPQSLVLTNSIARTLGLHDFYQVGLWNFCEGYNNEGITYCSDPKAMYWFNPVEIILSELFYGASIALPSQVNSILSILQLASHVMFGCFLAAACLAFVLIPVSFVVIKSRLWSGVVSVFALINTLLIIVGSAVGTAMGIIAQYALSSQPELNVKCDLGITMYVLMWIAAAFSLLAFFVHASMCCCCMSRRDLTSGRRNLKTSRKAGGDDRVANDYGESTGANNDGVVEEKKKHGYSLPKFHKMHRRPSTRG